MEKSSRVPRIYTCPLMALPPPELSPLLAELAPNIVADLVSELSPHGRRAALEALPAEQRQRVQTLLRYAPDTAGGVMSNRFIALRSDMTVEQVRELLRDRAQEERTEDIAYLYVTDAEQRLTGIVSPRDLVFRRAERRMDEILAHTERLTRKAIAALPDADTSAGMRSPVLGKTIALARLDVTHAEIGAQVEIGKLDGHQKRLPATIVLFAHYDPKKEKPRS